MIIEGTLRDPMVTLGSAQSLIEFGYRCELHVIIAHEFFSRLRIFDRYLKQKEADGAGRYTLLSAHNIAYEVLPQSLATIVTAGLFERVVLYSIEQEVLFDSAFSEDSVRENVQAIVSYVRSELHQSAERLLVDINNIRQLASSLECAELVMSDIKRLADEIISYVGVNSSQ